MFPQCFLFPLHPQPSDCPQGLLEPSDYKQMRMCSSQGKLIAGMFWGERVHPALPAGRGWGTSRP